MGKGKADNITIERARRSDAEDIKKLEVECGLCAWSRDDYLQEISRNNELFLVVRKDLKLVGFILARLIMSQSNSIFESEAEIYNIAIHIDYRREKIASRLIDELIQTGIRKKVGKVQLEVRESNHTAHKFYSQNLFKIVGKRNNFYTNPTENAILMCRELSSEKNM